MADFIFQAIYDNKEVTAGIASDVKSFTKLSEVATKATNDQKKGFKEVAVGAQAADEAIKAIPKTIEKGTNELAKLKKEIKDYKAAAIEAGEETPIGQEFLKKAAEATDRLGDINAAVNRLASDTSKLDGLVGAGRAIAAGFSLAQGAAGLFGSSSEDLQKSILKVQSAMAVLNGLTEIQNALQKESAVRIFLTETANKAAAIATTIYSTAVGVATGQISLSSVATTAWGVATKAALGPIGLVVGLVGAAVTAFVLFSKQLEDVAEKEERLNKILERTKSELTGLADANDAYIKLRQEQGAKEAELDKLRKGSADIRRKAIQEEIKVNNELTEALRRNLKIQQDQQIENDNLSLREDIQKTKDQIRERESRYFQLNDLLSKFNFDQQAEDLRAQKEEKKKKDDADKEILKRQQEFNKKYNELVFFTGEQAGDIIRNELKTQEKDTDDAFAKLLSIQKENGKEQEEINKNNLESYKSNLKERADATEKHRLEELKKQQEYNAFAFQTAEQFGAAMNQLFQAQANGTQLDLQKAAKAVLTLTLDTIEKILIANTVGAQGVATVQALSQPGSVASFGAAGLIQSAVLVGLIKAAFEAAKAAINSQGFYDGGYTGDAGERQVAGVVHGKEFVSTADTTRKHRPILEALHAEDYSKLSMLDLAPLLEGTGVTLKKDLTQNVINTHSQVKEAERKQSDHTARELAEIKKEMKRHFNKSENKPSETILPDGTRIIKKGSTTRIIRKK